MASKPNSTTAPTCDGVSSGSPPYVFDRPWKRCMRLGWELILQQNCSSLPAKAHVAAVKAPKNSPSFFLPSHFLSSSASSGPAPASPVLLPTPTPPPQRTQRPSSSLKMTRRNRELGELVRQREDTHLIRAASHATYLKWGNNSLRRKITSFPPFQSCSYTTAPLYLGSLCTEAISLTSKLPPTFLFSRWNRVNIKQSC